MVHEHASHVQYGHVRHVLRVRSHFERGRTTIQPQQKNRTLRLQRHSTADRRLARTARRVTRTRLDLQQLRCRRHFLALFFFIHIIIF